MQKIHRYTFSRDFSKNTTTPRYVVVYVQWTIMNSYTGVQIATDSFFVKKVWKENVYAFCSYLLRQAIHSKGNLFTDILSIIAPRRLSRNFQFNIRFFLFVLILYLTREIQIYFKSYLTTHTICVRSTKPFSLLLFYLYASNYSNYMNTCTVWFWIKHNCDYLIIYITI